VDVGNAHSGAFPDQAVHYRLTRDGSTLPPPGRARRQPPASATHGVVASGVISMPRRVDDELEWSGRQLPKGSDHRVRHVGAAAVDEEDSVAPDLDGNVPPRAAQHVHVALHTPQAQTTW
jgi:hypothetical protein